MPKTMIKVTINNEHENIEYKVPAIIQEDSIKYRENKDTLSQFNYQKNTLFRENKDLQMKYYFNTEKSTMGEILIKDLEKSIKLRIKTNKIERKDQNIEIIFSVEGKDFLYKIEEIK